MVLAGVVIGMASRTRISLARERQPNGGSGCPDAAGLRPATVTCTGWDRLGKGRRFQWKAAERWLSAAFGRAGEDGRQLSGVTVRAMGRAR